MVRGLVVGFTIDEASSIGSKVASSSCGCFLRKIMINF